MTRPSSHCFRTNSGVGEVGKLLGEKWKELSAKDKEPYEKKAKTDKERYEREKAEYAGGVSVQYYSFTSSLVLTT